MSFVLSSISGNLISAASAGFAPTNSADVSAIASAYQVVSATATQLYAGTSYLTGVNEAPISAARAGNAANASLATSAYYDGTGRLISSLPDSAAVSSIASSYAEAAASGKLDTTAFNSGDFYSTANPSGFITGVDLSDYATTAYVDSSVSSKLDASAEVVTSVGETSVEGFTYVKSINEHLLRAQAANFATVASSDVDGNDITATYATTAYVDSSVSSKLDASAFNSSDFYSTSNPSGFITSAPFDSATCSAIASAYAESAVSSVSGNYYPMNGNPSGFITGVDLSNYATTGYVDSSVSSKLDSTAFNSGDFYSTSNPSGFITGVDLSEYATTGYVNSSVSSKLDTTAFNSSDFYTTANESGFITGVDLSNYATTGYVDSSVSSKLDSTAFNSGDFYSTSNPSGFLTGVDLSPYQTTADMSSYIPTSMSSDFQQVTGMSSYVPYSSIGYNTASAISGINGSALAGTTYSAGTGIDITDDVISVETPVDIVAGPGIVVDNPDGNTLRVSMASNYETVLWSGTKYWWSDTANLQLSEAASHFETIRVKAKDDWALPHAFTFFPGDNAAFDVSLIGYEGGKLTIKTSKFNVSGTTVSLSEKIAINVGSDKTVTTNTSVSFVQFSEIVGINRTASAQ